jgi:Putative, 10TM heavy-metal exporter
MSLLELTGSEPASPPALLLEVGLTAVEITLFVFLTMIVVDYVNVWTQGRLTTALNSGRGRQYVISSALGVIPGCFGVFLAVTLYLRGMFTFGGLAACFFSTIGDVSFVLLAKDPLTSLRLAVVLFLIGIVFGYLIDRLVAILKMRPDARCTTEAHHLGVQECRCWPEEDWLNQLRHPLLLRVAYIFFVLVAIAVVLFGISGPQEWNGEKIGVLLLLLLSCFVVVTVPDHYLVEHIGHHITRHHLPRIFMWISGTLLVLALAERFFDLKAVASEHALWVMGAAALAGLIPDSGPQLAFVFLYIGGAIPFSVLLANSVAQSGHGLLPLLSVSIRDSVMVKFFNICLGLLAGYAALAAGW